MYRLCQVIIVICFLLSSFAVAQESPPAAPLDDTKPISFYVSAAKNFKVGKTTDSEVIAALGQPRKISTGEKIKTGRGGWSGVAGADTIIKDKILYYGSKDNIIADQSSAPNPTSNYAVVISINKSNGTIRKIDINP